MTIARQPDVLTSCDKPFHKLAAAIANDLSPAFTWVRTTVNKLLLAERNVLVGLYGHIRSDIYFGTSPCTTL